MLWISDSPFKTPHVMNELSMTLQSWLEWSLWWGNSLVYACHNTWQHVIKWPGCLGSKLCTRVCHNVFSKHWVIFWQRNTMWYDLPQHEERLEWVGQILQQSILISQQNSPPCWAWVCTPVLSALESDFTPFSPALVFSEGGSGNSFTSDFLIHRSISLKFFA